MITTRQWMISLAAAILFLIATLDAAPVHMQDASSAAASSTRAIGSVVFVSGNTLKLKTDSGSEVSVSIGESTRVVKATPGQKDLKNATPIPVQDIQTGDRALVRGTSGEAANSMVAASIVVMKQGDVATRQQQDTQDWQRRGIGGIVRSVDATSGAIIVGSGPNQTIAIQPSGNTQFLRYANDSVKFSDAKQSTFGEIKPGDQLRARGTRSPDGQQLAADAVISGSFRNIAGTVNSVDAAAGALSVMDLITKRPAIVKITSDTQMRKIPAETAQRIAMFLKRPANSTDQTAGADPGGVSGQGMRAGGQNGPPDFQQVIRRMPAATISELQKGDAVMIVATSASSADEVTALTLLSGVEPILTATPTQAGAANLLSGWSMGGGEGEN